MLKCNFISLEQRRSEEDLSGLFLESTEGQLGILPGHLPIIIKLKDNSTIRLKKEIGELKINVGQNSFFQFKDDLGTILTSQFSKAEEY